MHVGMREYNSVHACIYAWIDAREWTTRELS